MRKLLSFFVALFAMGPAYAEPLSAWIQMAPGGAAEIRFVTSDAICPAVSMDGTDVPMATRAGPDAAFPVRLCSVTLKPGTKTASLLGRPMALPIAAPQRILVLGDTGCRIKGKTVQACNDPSQWPFPQVASAAAKLKPDLVIHVGDYLYRESPCPADNAGCVGSPWGDNWTTWAADFFTPARPLLEAAPWVIVRGNHEDCQRAGPGFLRLLGPLAVTEGTPCNPHVAPYAVPLGDVTLVVTDNASAADVDSSDALVETYEGDFTALKTLAVGPTWTAGHHPIWGIAQFKMGMVVGGNDSLEKAEDAIGLPANLDLMLSGHIHTFEAIDYAGGLPPQLVVGEGGDRLDEAPPDLSGYSVGTAKITKGLSLPGWGFLLMTRQGGGEWAIDVFDQKGAHERSCRYKARTLDCGAAQKPNM